MAYDVVVIGARCAGSPTAMLLAQKGYRVLVVDRATFPSDTVSTHFIHPPGVAALSRWGLLDRVRATGCPPVTTYSFDFGPFKLAGSPRAFDGNAQAYGPRRTVLDKILVDAEREVLHANRFHVVAGVGVQPRHALVRRVAEDLEHQPVGPREVRDREVDVVHPEDRLEPEEPVELGGRGNVAHADGNVVRLELHAVVLLGRARA